MEKEPLLTQVWEISTTVASEEVARKIANSLLESHLVACIQISGPIRSLYRWKGAIQEDLEWKLAIKTSGHGLEACWSEIRRLHPYEVPELIACSVAKVSTDYEQWLLEQISIPAPSKLPLAWHLRIARFPSNATPYSTALILGRQLQTLALPTGPSPLAESFESVADQLSLLPNLHFESDGSFFWCSIQRLSTPGRSWQLDGMVYDRENRVEYVELKGNCDQATWETLTRVLSGVEYVPLIVQWVEQGIWISEPEFRRCLI